MVKSVEDATRVPASHGWNPTLKIGLTALSEEKQKLIIYSFWIKNGLKGSKNSAYFFRNAEVKKICPEDFPHFSTKAF